MLFDFTYMWHLKQNKSINKTETKIQEINSWLQSGEAWGIGKTGEGD